MLSSIDTFLAKNCELLAEGTVPLLRYHAASPKITSPYEGFTEVKEEQVATLPANLACYRTPALTVFSRYLNSTPRLEQVGDVTLFADALMMHPRIFLWGPIEGIYKTPPIGGKAFQSLEFWGLKLTPLPYQPKPRWRP